jgi:DNA-binding MarR family transcriptional regulator
MNSKAVKWAWKQPIENQTTRIVLLTLAFLSNNTGAIEASQNRIMKEARLGRRALIKHLNTLEYDGYIFRRKNYRQNGRRAVNTYYLSYGGSSRHLAKDSAEAKLAEEILRNPEEYRGLW